MIQRNNFLLTELNVHRVVICAVLLAAKFFDDAYYNNAFYAKVGGVLVSEINGLEVDFLFRINFSLHVPPEEFEKYRAELWQQPLTPLTEPMYPAPVQVSPEVHSAPATMEAEPMGIAPCAAQLVQTPMDVVQPTTQIVVEDLFMANAGGSFPNNYFVMPHPNHLMHRANSMPPVLKQVSPTFPHLAGGMMMPMQPRIYQPDPMMEQQYGMMMHHHHGPVVVPSNVTCVPSSPSEGMGRRVAGMSGAGM